MKKFHVKKGDKVMIIAGENKGKTGVITKVLREKERVLVDGEEIKKLKKHTRPTAANPNGGIIEIEPSIHISNVMLIDPATGNPGRVGRRKNEEGKSERYVKVKN